MRKLLLFLLVVLAIVPLASAAFPQSGLYAYYNHDETSGTTLIDTFAGRNGTLVNTPTLGVYGIDGTAINYTSGANEYANVNTVQSMTYTTFTISMWWVGGAPTASSYMFGQSNGGASNNDDLFCYRRTDNKLTCRFNNGAGNNDILSTNTFEKNNLHHLVYKYDGSRCELYVDDVLEGTNTGCSGEIDVDAFYIGAAEGELTEINTHVDEFALWSVNLTRPQVTETNSTFFEVASTSIVASSPPDNSSFNTNPVEFQLNLTSDTGLTYNVSLWINNTLNQTYTGLLGGTNNTFNVTFTPATYTYTLGWYDGTSGTNTSTRTLYYDTALPTITQVTPAHQFYYLNFTTNITIADENLYSYNYNITYQNGTVIHSEVNTSLTGLGTRQIGTFVDLSAHQGHNLVSDIQVCDGHTAHSINDYQISRINGGLLFDNVRIIGQGSNAQTYTKKTDRYSFGFTYDTPSITRTFRIQSNKYIDILHGRTKYQGHLVTGGRWIDLEMLGTSVVSIERVSPVIVDVTILSAVPLSSYNFNSIGSLNCVTQKSHFYSLKAVQSTQSGALTGQILPYQLNISFNASYATPITATFNYNNTVYGTSSSTNTSTQYTFNTQVATPIISSQNNFTYYWTFNTPTAHTTTAQVQSANVPSLDTCSTNTIPFLNVTIRDEISNALVSSAINYIFEYSQGSFSATLNNSIASASNAQWCKYPANTTFLSDWHIQYKANGYATRDYYVEGWTINDTLTFKTLYSLSNANATSINIHVKDDADNDLSDILIEIYRYNIPTNTYLLVDTKKTDTDGNGVVNLNTDGHEYKVKLYQNGALAVETNRFQMFNTNYEYTISARVTNPLSEYLRIKTDVNHTLSYLNTTKLVNLTYAFATGVIDHVCLTVNSNGTDYYSTCTQNTSGSLLFTVTQLNLSYTAVLTANSTLGNTYLLDALGFDTRTTFKDLIGIGTGVILSFILFILLSFIAIVNVTASIVGGLIALIFLWLIGILQVPLPILIGVIIGGISAAVVINRGKTQ